MSEPELLEIGSDCWCGDEATDFCADCLDPICARCCRMFQGICESCATAPAKETSDGK